MLNLVLAYPRRSLKQALRYLFPRRLTLKHNPKICTWLWWNYGNPTNINKEINSVTIHEDLIGNYHYHIAIDDEPLCGKKDTMRRQLRLESWGLVTHIGERYCSICNELAIQKGLL